MSEIVLTGMLYKLYMTRRVDNKTAELVEIALLTRAAFEQKRAATYASIAGVPCEVMERIFARSPGSFRSGDVGGGGMLAVDRRKSSR